MYTIDQEIANQIALTQKMAYKEMEKLFLLEEEQADKWDVVLKREVEAETNSNTARAVLGYLALYMENKAITRFINMNPRSRAMLRNIMPEILTTEEAAQWARRDNIFLTDEEMDQTAQMMLTLQNRFKTEQDEGE